MNKICIVGDLHFGYGNVDFLNSQLRFFRDVLIPYLSKNRINKIIFTGDFFDNRKNLDIYVKNKVCELIENDLKDFEILIYLGNHDVYYKNNNDVHSLRFLKLFSNVRIIEKITTEKVYGKNFLFVPWLYDLTVFRKYIDENDISEIDVCFGHFDIIGSKMSKNTFSKSGLTKSLLTNFKLVFSGHYHSRSVDNNIVYVGTPYQLNRGDMNEDRGFCILNCDDLSYLFIENQASIKFVSVNYPDPIEPSSITGNIVDVIVNDDGNVDYDDVQNYIDSIMKYNPIQEPRKKILTDINTVDVKDIKVKNLKELFDEYIQQLNINNEIKRDVIEEIDGLFLDCQSEL